MPAVVAGSAIGAGLGWAMGAGAFGTLFVQNLALGLVSKALAPKPPTPERRDNTVTAREPASSRKIVYGRTRVGGTIVYLESTGDDNKYLHLVVAIAGHEIDAYEKVYFDDQLVWDGGSYQDDWDDHVRLNFHEGSDSQPANANLVSESSSWTNEHRLRGVAYIYARLKYDQDRYSSGIPNITATVRGKKVLDPRSGVTSWSFNPALCIRDYLLDPKYGIGVDAAELNASSFNAAANLCDELVATSSGSQSRYTLDGVIDTASTPKDNLEGMLTSCAGSLVYSGGEFFLFGSAYKTPTITLDESVVTGSMSIQTRKSRRELFNAVKGIFSSEADNYVLTDYPAIVSSTYQAEDGGEIYLDVDLPYTTNPIRAERIAKLSLLRTRQQITATIPCNLSALRLKAGDTVMINNARFGWTNKVFEIINLRLSADESGALGVELQVIETAPAVYDWTTDDEIDFVPGQPTTLATPASVIPPTITSLTPGAETQGDGTTRSFIDVEWTNNDAFSAQFEVQFQTGLSPFQSIVTRNTYFRIYDVLPDSSYVIRVRAINNLGARSEFDTESSVAIGDPDGPAAPSNFSVDTDLTSFVLTWDVPTDLDFLYVEAFRSSEDNFENSVSIGRTYGTILSDHNFGDGVTQYYWIRAYDRTGNSSSVVGPQSATISYDPRSPRQTYGYVYYTISSETAPANSPSATSYDFVNGDLVGLTPNWQIDPLTIESADGTYWASRFNVQEASFGGSQTITFSTPFQSIQFDGLVTFTNLNNELSDPNSSQITTIDGGLIKTGIVEANRIELDGNTIEAGASGIQIKNLGVDTLQIADNAVIIPVSQTVDTIELGTGSFKEIQWLNVTLDQGARLVVLWSGSQFYGGGLKNNFFQLRIDGAVVQERGGLAVTVAPSLSYSEEKNAGTYRVAVWWNGEDSTIRVTQRTLTILGAKK